MIELKKAVKFVIGLSVIGATLLLYLNSGGNTGKVNRRVGYTENFSEDDIIAAMDEVEKKFRQKYKGCILTDLWYDEFYNDRMSEEWKEQYGADEAIVLLSNYKVDEAGGDGSLNPDETYSNWQWILVRSGQGSWKLKTWGYG